MKGLGEEQGRFIMTADKTVEKKYFTFNRIFMHSISFCS